MTQATAELTRAEYPASRASTKGIFALEYMRGLPPEGLTAAERVFLHHVVTTEDAAYYRGPVTFWLRQLAGIIGCSTDTVARVRQRLIDGGWLAYIPPDAPRLPGRYWVIQREDPERDFDRTGAAKPGRFDRSVAAHSTLCPRTDTSGRRPEAGGRPPKAVPHRPTGHTGPAALDQETQSFEQQAPGRLPPQTPKAAHRPPEKPEGDRMNEPNTETPQTAANATTRSETPPFPLLTAAAAEWAELMGENPVPACLAEFQLELLDWARYRRSSLGPNWDPFCLEPDLVRAARIGCKLKTAVDWAIRMRKDKIPDPKHECDLPMERLASWHRLRLRADSEGWTGLDDRTRRLLKRVGEAEGFHGKEEFLAALTTDSGRHDLKRAVAYFKALDEETKR